MKEIQRVLVSEVTWTRARLAERARRMNITHLRDIVVPDDRPGERPGVFAVYHEFDGQPVIFRIDPNEGDA